MLKPADVLEVLSQHVGAESGISAERLVEALTGEKNPAAERMLRRIITHLRMDGECICGHPTTGYYLAENAEQMQQTLTFLRSRAMTSLVQEARLRRVALPELLGQMTMELQGAA